MANVALNVVRKSLATTALFALIGGAALAQGAPREITAEEYSPTIWIDPDGCEHWVMDDGFEGYMSPHRKRNGEPVCHRSEICGVVPADTLFSTNGHRISSHARRQLIDFFKSADAFGFMIYGHTDARASDEYNMRLSARRAATVADAAREAGVRVVDVQGFGERRPAVHGTSAAAYAKNRRVEIYCVK